MKTHFNIGFLEDATETLRAIAHPIRIAIVDMLFKNNQLSVSEIHDQLQIEQAVASHHLRILKNKKIVIVNRDGKNSYYSLTHKDYHNIIQVLTKTI
ncbi:MAG: metalloregulator ArsR/SmtB family transcription factor [Bacteroidota bacterium]